jgi:hypothetical protein
MTLDLRTEKVSRPVVIDRFTGGLSGTRDR